MPYLSNDPTSQSVPSSPAFYRLRVQSTPAAEPMQSAPSLPTSATMSPPIKSDNVNPIDLHTGLWQCSVQQKEPQQMMFGEKVLWRNLKFGPPSSAPPAGPLPALPEKFRSTLSNLDEYDRVKDREVVEEHRRSMEERGGESAGEREWTPLRDHEKEIEERVARNVVATLEMEEKYNRATEEERKYLFAGLMKYNIAAQKAKEEADHAESKTVEQRRNEFAEQMKRNLAAQKRREEETAGVERIEVAEWGPKVEEGDEAVRARHRFVEFDGVEEGGVSER